MDCETGKRKEDGDSAEERVVQELPRVMKEQWEDLGRSVRGRIMSKKKRAIHLRIRLTRIFFRGFLGISLVAALKRDQKR